MAAGGLISFGQYDRRCRDGVGLGVLVERKDRRHCDRCNSWVPIKRERCPNCLAELSAPLTPEPMLVGQDGMALASHVGLQLDGVPDPEVRMARLVGVRMDLEHAIASGALTEADEVDHANSYIEWVDQQGQQYLIAARAGGDRRAASRLRSGVTVLAVGLALSIVTYLI